MIDCKSHAYNHRSQMVMLWSLLSKQQHELVAKDCSLGLKIPGRSGFAFHSSYNSLITIRYGIG